MSEGPGRFELALGGAFASVGSYQLGAVALGAPCPIGIQYMVAITGGALAWLAVGRRRRARQKASRP